MRVCVEKNTGALLEMQSDAIPGTLIKNALNAGYGNSDIEEKEVTKEEYEAILDAQPKLPQPLSPSEEIALLKMSIAELTILIAGGV